MSYDEKRLLIAEALAEARRRSWVFSPDHSIPDSAVQYCVYDGVEVIGGGFVVSGRALRAAALVARAKMPIVFYLPRCREDE